MSKGSKKETFTEWYSRSLKSGIVFPGMSSDQALDFLVQYLLPDTYYTFSIHAHQANTEIVYDILMKYSKKFKKEVKQYNKEIHQYSVCVQSDKCKDCPYNPKS